MIIGCHPPLLSLIKSTTLFFLWRGKCRDHCRQLKNMPLLSSPNVLMLIFSPRISQLKEYPFLIGNYFKMQVLKGLTIYKLQINVLLSFCFNSFSVFFGYSKMA